MRELMQPPPGQVWAVYQGGPVDGERQLVELRHGAPPQELRVACQPPFSVSPADDVEAGPVVVVYRPTGDGCWTTSGQGPMVDRRWVEAVYEWRRTE